MYEIETTRLLLRLFTPDDLIDHWQQHGFGMWAVIDKKDDRIPYALWYSML